MEGDHQFSSSKMEDDQLTKKVPRRPDIVYIKDFPFPASSRFKRENIMSALAFSPKEDDFIVSSYPKTGTTWVEYIVVQILHRGELFPSMLELNHKLIPYLDRVGASVAENMSPPRMAKFHLPFHLTPYNRKARYLYVIRNPKDVAVSYFHFLGEVEDHQLSFDEFFEFFVTGQVPYGNYLEHLRSWLPHKDDENVFVACYEKVLLEVESEVLRLAKFLGEDHYDAFSKDPELMTKILKATSFQNMSENLVLKRQHTGANGAASSASSDQRTVKFFRKGKAGDWKNHLSPEQVRFFDEKIEQMVEDEEILKLWKQ